MPIVGLAAVTELQGICQRSVTGQGGSYEKSTERSMGMSIEEAIRRLVDVAKTLEPDSNTYIAFRMAVEALWAQERNEDDGK